MNARELNTKEKILSSASSLFAVAGYEGASIREIARNADVNIAAVNYHFTNKETLYWETFVRAMADMEQRIGTLDKSLDIESFVLAIFNTMRANRAQMLNAFKMVLSDSMPDPSCDYQEFCTNKEVGPPGAEHLAEVMIGEVGQVEPNALKMAVKSIFSHTVHIALIVDTAYVKRWAEGRGQELAAEMEQTIRFHTKAIVSYLKSAR